jgi:hypothetical protein
MGKCLQNILKNGLLAFVLVSVGFALGKEMTLRRQAPAAGAPPSGAAGDRVIVYYVHTTFRCVTCNEIERLAKALVETEFAGELRAGRIEWKAVNFQQDEALAKRYEVASSCVVVVKMRGGKEAGYQRLDEVWTHYQDPPSFNAYVGGAIRRYLGGAES